MALSDREYLERELARRELARRNYLSYLYYNQENTTGYYITNGQAIKVTWAKAVANDKLDYEITKFYDENGDEIEINPGKTYIALVPKDGWSTVTLN